MSRLSRVQLCFFLASISFAVAMLAQMAMSGIDVPPLAWRGPFGAALFAIGMASGMGIGIMLAHKITD